MSEESETNQHAKNNSIGVLGALAISIGSIVYSAGYLGATVDDQDRRIEKIEERPVTDTTEIEKTISVLLSKVDNLSGNADTVQGVKEDVVKLKVEVEQLVNNINGIPNEFPSLQQKVQQLADAIDKLQDKQQ